MAKQSSDYNKRFVYYEKIHQIQNSDFDKISELTNLKDGDKVLDYGGGYGSVIKQLIERNKGKEVQYFLLEPSSLQINRARYFLENYRNYKIEFIQSDLISSKFNNNFFTHIISKVVLHELSIEKQQTDICEMYRILQESGSLYIWTIECDNLLQPFVQNFFRKKDKISNLSKMAKERYFASREEFDFMLDKARFSRHSRSFFQIEPMRYSTKNQLDGDFRGDEIRLERFNRVIRKMYSLESLKNKSLLSFTDEGNSITVKFPQYIIQNVK